MGSEIPQGMPQRPGLPGRCCFGRLTSPRPTFTPHMALKKKWIALPLGVVVLLVLLYGAAGPYLAIRGIRHLVASGQTGELWRFVDFASLKDSLRPQLEQKVAAGVLARIGSNENPLTIGKVSALIAQPTLDLMASPRGLAVLLQGSALARTTPAGTPNDPLRDARTAFVSPSRFTATVASAEGKPVVFEFRRDGLSWKLAALYLPD